MEKITVQLLLYGYQKIHHKRISFINKTTHKSNINIYEGLSLVTSASDNTLVMIKWRFDTKKSLKQTVHENTSQLKNEHTAISDLQKLPSVIKCLSSSFTPNNLMKRIDNNHKNFEYIAYPYYKEGTLKGFFQKIKQSHTIQQSMLILEKITQYLINSINEVHNAGWIHGDIKPSNIMIETINKNTIITNFQVILIDFALACKLTLNKKNNLIASKTTSGTPAYIAPECWQGAPKSRQTDYYALGITLYEIFTGSKPYTKLSNETNFDYCRNTAQKISKSYFLIQVTSSLNLCSNISQNTDKKKNNQIVNSNSYKVFINKYYDFIADLLSEDPKKRHLNL